MLSSVPMPLRFLPAALLTLIPTVAHAKEVTVAGRLINGSGGTAPFAPVTLLRAKLVREGERERIEEIPLAQTKADAQGRFTFTPMTPLQNDLLLARADWQGYTYKNVAFQNVANPTHMEGMGAKNDPGKVEVVVFNGTDKPVPITARVHHLAIKSDGGQLKCVERYVWTNGSTKTYTGAGPHKVTVRLNLPKEAQNVKIDPKIRNAKLVKLEDGWGVAQPLPPAGYDEPALIVNYTMPWPLSMPWARGINLSRTVRYPTNFFFVARETDDQKLQVRAPKLSADQQTELPIDNGTELRIVNSIGAPMVEKAALTPGTKVDITIARPISPLFYAFCLFLGALVVGVPLSLAGGKKRAAGEREALFGSAKTLEPSGQGGVLGASFAPNDFTVPQDARTQQLIADIARLDEQWEAGTLNDSEYRVQRTQRKTELVEHLEQAS